MHTRTTTAHSSTTFAVRRPETLRQSGEIEARWMVGTLVDGITLEQTVRQVIHAASRRVSATVCIANVHMLMEGYDNPDFARQLNSADLVVPDGMPLVWMLRRLGLPGQTRVAGPDLMPALCAAAARADIPVGFLGGQPAVLHRAIAALQSAAPGLRVVFATSPPYRLLDAAEDVALVEGVNASGAAILFVALGCPKQEQWMYEHRDRVQAVLVGIGAALDFTAGSVSRAPAWMQASGLEWLFRLCQEPGRLWRRYLWHNPRFAWLAATSLWPARPSGFLPYGYRTKPGPR